MEDFDFDIPIPIIKSFDVSLPTPVIKSFDFEIKEPEIIEVDLTGKEEVYPFSLLFPPKKAPGEQPPSADTTETK